MLKIRMPIPLISDPGNLFAIDVMSGEISAATDIAPENQYFAGGSITLTAYVRFL